MSEGSTTRFFSGGLSVSLESPPPVLEGFLKLFSAFPSSGQSDGAHLNLRVACSTPDCWVVEVDGIRAASFDAPELIPPFLETLVCQFLIQQRADRIPIHASGVARDGSAVIMPGEKGSGKSTLALWLASRGFDYLGDELLWIDPVQDAVEPFPKAAAIKSGAFDLFENAESFQSPTRGPLRYFLPPRHSSQICPVARIVFPCFSQNESCGVHALQPEETLLYLSRMLFGGLARRPERFPALVRLAARPACLAVYRDAREIEDVFHAERCSR